IRILATQSGTDCQVNALTGRIGAARHPRGKGRVTECYLNRTWKPVQAGRFKVLIEPSEMLFYAHQVAPIVARRDLSKMREPEAGVAAFPLGKVNYLIR